MDGGRGEAGRGWGWGGGGLVDKWSGRRESDDSEKAVGFRTAMPNDNEVPNNGCGQYNAGSMHCSSPFGSQSILFRLPSAPPWAQPGVVRSPATYRWIIQPSLLAPVHAPKSTSLRLHCFPSEFFQQVGIFLSSITAEFYVDRVRQAVHYQTQFSLWVKISPTTHSGERGLGIMFPPLRVLGYLR